MRISDWSSDVCSSDLFRELPQAQPLLGLLAAIDPVEAALRLVARAVVVDQGDGVDAPARGRLDIADVVPDARIAGEAEDRPVGRPALGAAQIGRASCRARVGQYV